VSRRVAEFFVDVALAANPHELAAIKRLAGSSDCQVEVSDAAFADRASLERALEDFADLYRGETIALVASGDVIQSLLRCARTPTEPIAIAIDDSGWAAIPCRES
jgi:broad specificity phosphatase PhoE